MDQRLRIWLEDAPKVDEPLSLGRRMRRQLLLDLVLQVGNRNVDRQVGEDNAVPELFRWTKDPELDVSSRVDGRSLLGLLLGRLLGRLIPRLLRRRHAGGCEAVFGRM